MILTNHTGSLLYEKVLEPYTLHNTTDGYPSLAAFRSTRGIL